MSNKIQTAVIPADKVFKKEDFEHLLTQLNEQAALLKEYNKSLSVIKKNKKLLEDAIKSGLETIDGQKLVVLDRLLVLKETTKESKKVNFELLKANYPEVYDEVVTITTKVEKKLSNTKVKV